MRIFKNIVYTIIFVAPLVAQIFMTIRYYLRDDHVGSTIALVNFLIWLIVVVKVLPPLYAKS